MIFFFFFLLLEQNPFRELEELCEFGRNGQKTKNYTVCNQP